MMRSQVHQKYGGRCASCGTEITIKQMQVDHFKPIYRNWGNTHPLPDHAGTDTLDNMMPACAPCNRWKSTMPLEEFRAELAAQVERLRRDSASFRMAERHGLVVTTGNPVVFWFEAEDNDNEPGKQKCPGEKPKGKGEIP